MSQVAPSQKQVSIRSWITLFFLSLVWGTSYILIKKGLVAFTPFQMGCIRISVSALAFIPYLAVSFRRVDWSRWHFLLLVGLTGTAIPSFLFPIAQTEISSSVAGILNSMTPLFTLIFGVLLFGYNMMWSKLLGVLMGLGGAAMLILFGNQGGIEGNMLYGLFALGATFCYAISGNVVGAKLADLGSIMISAVSFVMVGIPAMIILFTTDFINVLQTHPEGWTALGYVTLLALMSTVMASVLFFRLVHDTNPVFASTVSYVVPAVAVLWGIFDGEIIGLYHLLAMAFILLGVYLSRR